MGLDVLTAAYLIEMAIFDLLPTFMGSSKVGPYLDDTVLYG